MSLVLKKVSVHNLKKIDVTIPLGRLVVFTGVSGSGKSSLLFDTIYAEGQHRYLESLSPHVRRALGELPKPNLQSVRGLAPTIALEQRLSSHTPRSTVGTMTGVYDFMRVLFARVAIPYCPVSNEPVTAQSREKIIAKLKESYSFGTKMVILSPYAKGKKSSFREEFAGLLRSGFTRARVDNSFIELGEVEELDGSVAHDVDLVIDRIIRSDDSDSRLAEAVVTALDLGCGFFSVYDPDRDQESFFSETSYSRKSGISYAPLRPQDFSFNHPDGMCPACHGLGCSVCQGVRIKPYPAAAQFSKKRIGELIRLSIEELLHFFNGVQLSPLEMQIAEELLKEIKNHLSFLIRVGLPYLSLDRTAPTLSGGEAQRVRLASQIGSGLVGAIYILDEPSIGLHPHDHNQLLDTLFHLRDLGNSVFVVEHDLATMHAADWLIDVGPGAGPLGGRIIAEGTVEDLMHAPESITGAYLAGRLQIELPQKQRPTGEKKLEILGAHHHNLKNINVTIPLSTLVCVTGVSGSGKSSLISDLLVPALQNHFHRSKHPVGSHHAIKGLEYLKKIIAVDQSPIGRSSRSNPATYCKIFDRIDLPFKGRSLADFLKMSVDEALSFFKNHKKLEIMQRVGLGYLTLGQNAMTLSGGESQRIKLARELARPSTHRTLYVLDEPTTGLHLHDLKYLVAVLQELVDKGSTVLVIEHNMELVKTADWIIDLGNGSILGEGPPEKIAELPTPTGKALSAIKKPKELPKGRTPLPSPPSLKIQGARQNNLKNLSLTIPPQSLTIFSGPSGSGKTSLAFDTLFAEGQRRFAETLPPYARSFLKELPKPDVDEITGLSPVVGVEQKKGSLNPRSTIATMTKLGEALRILYADWGTPYDPQTGEEILRMSKEAAIDRILSLPQGEKIQILMPLPPQDKFEELLERLNREGFLRIRLNGTFYQLDEEIPKQEVKELHLVLDRLIVDAKARERLDAAIERAPEGNFVVVREPAVCHSPSFSSRKNLLPCKEELCFNLSFALTPNLFSFNSEEGMCSECQGLGVIYGAHLEKSDFSPLALFKLFIQEKENNESLEILKSLFARNGIDPAAPIVSLSEEARDFVLRGSPQAAFIKGLSYHWVGLHTLLERLARSRDLRNAILPFLQERQCETCSGERLNSLARKVLLNGVSLPELYRKNLSSLFDFLKNLPPSDLIEQISKQLKLLIDLGLHYLSLERSAPSLSSGELQRIRFANQAGLSSCLYLFDEPTAGLHPRDVQRLISATKELLDLGNTVIVVENDPFFLYQADYFVEFGPGAGKTGGKILTQGATKLCVRKLSIPQKRRPYSPDVRIEKASLHNLKNISIAFPKGSITCITGVSGAGKSSLLEVIKNSSASLFDHIFSIDQSPIGQTARADVGSYTKIQPLMRDFFSSLGSSRAKGLEAHHFSPNHPKGMCRTCKGLGFRSIDLQFLPEIRIKCDACNGYRLGPSSLEIKYREKNFGQILFLTVFEALELFSAIPNIAHRLQSLVDVGLSYLSLGQEIATLSGGEVQRLRLAAEFGKREAGNTLYLIEEPSVGLHSQDLALLLPLFHRLVDRKNTLVIVEHDLNIIANADYIIDLGPEAGDQGGRVVATGTPEEIASSQSLTGKFLSRFLNIVD